MASGAGLRILLLEDSILDAELMEDVLNGGGIKFEIRRVETGPAFEEQLAQFGPDLILSDYKLPGFDGGQALTLAKQRCPDAPVIVVSGTVGEETAVELLKNGATDFVLKDRLARLCPAIHRALREVRERTARRRAEHELLVLNAELEHRVAERTRELLEKNTLIEEDLGMARDLQRALLPQQFPTIPRGAVPAGSALKFSSIYRPSGTVSGDFFNVVRLSDTSVGIFICDVMGHGVRAALVTAMLRTLEDQLTEAAGSEPGTMLTEINRVMRGILRHAGTGLFITACYVVVDVAHSRMTFANAGHPSPLLVHRNPGEVERITPKASTGPALGLFEHTRYHASERPVAADDVILCFTDGLFEVENPSDEPFSEDRLRDSIRQRAGSSPDRLVEEVFADVERFANGRDFADDVCLVGVHVARLERAARESPTGSHSREQPKGQRCATR